MTIASALVSKLSCVNNSLLKKSDATEVAVIGTVSSSGVKGAFGWEPSADGARRSNEDEGRRGCGDDKGTADDEAVLRTELVELLRTSLGDDGILLCWLSELEVRGNR